MKTTEILKALNIVKPSKNEKLQASKIAEIFAMMKTFKPSDFLEVKNEAVQNFTFGTYSSDYSYYRQPEQYKGDLQIDAMRFTVKTLTGCYSQNIPMALYFDFLGLFPDHLTHLTTQKSLQVIEQPGFEIDFNQSETEVIKEALKFASNDSLRPAMCTVKIEIKNGNLVNVVATDGHSLYFENFTKFDLNEELEILIPANELKGLKKELNIKLFNESGKSHFATAQINNGLKFNLCLDQYPKYLNVWPQYSQFIEVNRKDILTALATTEKYANRVTHAVKLHVNGAIEVSAEDLDFANESGVKVAYEFQNTGDFDISFNAQFLMKAIKATKDKTVRMYSNGKFDSPFLIDGKVLVMQVNPIKIEETENN